MSKIKVEGFTRTASCVIGAPEEEAIRLIRGKHPFLRSDSEVIRYALRSLSRHPWAGLTEKEQAHPDGLDTDCETCESFRARGAR